MYEQPHNQTLPPKESLFKNKKYLMGVLTGFILASIVIVGISRYQESKILVNENGEIQNNEKDTTLSSSNSNELKEKIKADVDKLQNNVVVETMTPETPHSPQLQRLDLILREAEKMLDRMDKDLVKVNGTQTATINQ